MPVTVLVMWMLTTRKISQLLKSVPRSVMLALPLPVDMVTVVILIRQKTVVVLMSMMMPTGGISDLVTVPVLVLVLGVLALVTSMAIWMNTKNNSNGVRVQVEDEYDMFTIGGHYNFLEGLKTYAEVNFMEYDLADATPTAAENNDSEATSFIIGSNLTF